VSNDEERLIGISCSTEAKLSVRNLVFSQSPLSEKITHNVGKEIGKRTR